MARFTKYRNPNKKRRRRALSYDERLARAGSDVLFLQRAGISSEDAINYACEKYKLSNNKKEV